jgi:hypothetical protein
MAKDNHSATEKLIGTRYEAMDARQQKVARHIAERTHISRDLSQEQADSITFGQRAADFGELQQSV